jgi:hypothetical protein
MTPATSTTNDLAVLPEGSTLHFITATPAEVSEWIHFTVSGIETPAT